MTILYTEAQASRQPKSMIAWLKFALLKNKKAANTFYQRSRCVTVQRKNMFSLSSLMIPLVIWWYLWLLWFYLLWTLFLICKLALSLSAGCSSCCVAPWLILCFFGWGEPPWETLCHRNCATVQNLFLSTQICLFFSAGSFCSVYLVKLLYGSFFLLYFFTFFFHFFVSFFSLFISFVYFFVFVYFLSYSWLLIVPFVFLFIYFFHLFFLLFFCWFPMH